METTTPAYEQGLTFEKVWASLQEAKQMIMEQHKEIDRIAKENAERHKETERIIRENAGKYAERHEETERIIKKNSRDLKEYNKRFGDFSNRFGEVVEYMIVPNLLKKFKKMGFVFITAHQNSTVEDWDHNLFLEVDVLLANSDKVMAVEIKTKPRIEHIDGHVERMEKLRRYADLHADRRKYLGAVAGVVMNKEIKNYVFKNGFYAIEPSGETFAITPPRGLYSPREW